MHSLGARRSPTAGPAFPRLVESPTSAERVARIRAGDAAAFEALFRELYAPLTGYLRHATGSAAAAEDIAQDVFVAVWERRRELDPERPLRAYIFRAARNAVVSRGRRRRLELRIRAWLRLRPRTARAADAEVAERELGAALEAALAALPERCREVFLLARDAQLSYAEIAATLSLSPKTVENHMGRALRLLRAALRPFRD